MQFNSGDSAHIFTLKKWGETFKIIFEGKNPLHLASLKKVHPQKLFWGPVLLQLYQNASKKNSSLSGAAFFRMILW